MSMHRACASLTRRRFLAAGAGAALATGFPLPALSLSAGRPVFTHGVQSGDVDATSGVVWGRVDRPARVLIEYATTESFADPARLPPLEALPGSGLAVKRLLHGLPPGQEIFYRMVATDLADAREGDLPLVLGRPGLVLGQEVLAAVGLDRPGDDVLRFVGGAGT